MNKKTKDKVFRLAEKLDILIVNSHDDPGFFLIFDSHKQVSQFNYEWNRRTRASSKFRRVYELNRELFGMEMDDLRFGRAPVVDGVPYSKNKVPWDGAKISSNLRFNPRDFIVRAYTKINDGRQPRDFSEYEKAYDSGQLNEAIYELMLVQVKDKVGELYLASYLATGQADYILASPNHSPSPYLVPDGLTDIDDVGFPWGFNDEYGSCDHCNMVIQTSPDSGWLPEYYQFSDGEIICNECIISDFLDDYIEEHINQNKLVAIDINLGEFGFVQLDRKFENGFNYGQDDDPNRIISAMMNAAFDIVFTGSVSQFSISWVVWARPQVPEDWGSEYIWHKNANATCNNLNAYQGYSNAREFSRALSDQPSSHVNVVSRTISKDEFVSGDFWKESDGPITSITIGESND